VLIALILFGGESVRWFIAAFLIGLITGTYSSIFIASAVLVEWYKLDEKGFKLSKLLKLKRSKK
jgi:preprotein translocase subunit SecF